MALRNELGSLEAVGTAAILTIKFPDTYTVCWRCIVLIESKEYAAVGPRNEPVHAPPNSPTDQ